MQSWLPAIGILVIGFAIGIGSLFSFLMYERPMVYFAGLIIAGLCGALAASLMPVH